MLAILSCVAQIYQFNAEFAVAIKASGNEKSQERMASRVLCSTIGDNENFTNRKSKRYLFGIL